MFIIPASWLICSDIIHLASPLLMPTLTSVLNRLNNLVCVESINQDLIATTSRWIIGFILGSLAGIGLGLALGVSTRLKKLLEFPLEFLRAMPVTAIFPLFLMIFGIGDSSKIAMAFMPTFLLMTINTTYGVSLSDPTRRKMARAFGANKFQIFRTIVIMDALPQIFVGLRLTLSQSLVVIVVSEMFIGSDHGLGQRVYDSYLTNSVTTLYAFLIILGALGYFANKFLLELEAKLIFWTGK